MRPLTAWPACATHTGPSHTQRLCETLTGWLEWFMNFFWDPPTLSTFANMLQRLLALLAWHKLPRVSCQPLDQLRLSTQSFKQRTSEQDPEGRSRQRTSPLCCSMYLHADRDTTCDWRFGVMFKERLSISQEVDPATRVVSMDTLHKTRTARST